MKLAIASLGKKETNVSTNNDEPHAQNSIVRKLQLDTIHKLEKEHHTVLLQSSKISKEIRKHFPGISTCDARTQSYGYVAPISPYLMARLDALCSYLSLDKETRAKVISHLQPHSINHSSLQSTYNNIRSQLQLVLLRENAYLESEKQTLVKRLKDTQSKETLKEAIEWIETASLKVLYLNKPNPKRVFKAIVSFVLFFLACGVLLLRFLPMEFNTTK